MTLRQTNDAGGAILIHEYRGHRIHVAGAERWTAELVELASGSPLPTKLVACPGESFREFATRARQLVDTYLEAPMTGTRVLGPRRPWQTILS